MNRSVGIIGSGIIASSLAVLTTGHGLDTYVLVRSEAAARRLWKTFRDHYSIMIRQGILKEEQEKICESFLHVTQDYADLAGCSIFMEAVAEDRGVKASVFREIAKACPEVEMICSASSAITPDMMLEEQEEDPWISRIADRLIIAHPFNPPHMVPYFELCQSAQTRPGLIEEAAAFLRTLHREPVILKKPTPGFIGNRLQFALFREAMQLVEEGICECEDIDRALRYSFCPRYTSIGIFEHMDFAGLGLDEKNCRLLFPIISDRKDTPPILADLLAAGKTGTAAGEGFYDWRERDMEAYAQRVNEPFWKFMDWEFPESES